MHRVLEQPLLARDAKLRILMVAPTIPSPRHSGTGIRLYNTLRALEEIGAVTLFCLADSLVLNLLDDARPHCSHIVISDRQELLKGLKYIDPPRSRLKAIWNAVSSPKPLLARRHEDSSARAQLEDLLRHRFDLIWLCKTWLAAAFPFLLGDRTILDLDDLEHRVARRRLAVERFYPSKILEHLDALKLAWFERRIAQKCSRSLVCSRSDFLYLRCQNARVLPNCVDVPLTPCDPGHEREGLMVFPGFMRYPPNADGASYFCKEILPLIQEHITKARIAIVGGEPTSSVRNLHNGMDITVTGRVADMRPYLETASIIVVPIRIGGGTRVKILEALSVGKAVVSTIAGAEGLSMRSGEHLIVADSAREFADACIRLLRDSEERRRIGAAGRELVEARYSQPIFKGTVHELVSNALVTVCGGASIRNKGHEIWLSRNRERIDEVTTDK